MNARASQCVDDVLDLGADQPEVDRHRDEPGARERDVDLHPLDAVVGEQRDAVALGEAEAEQRVGEAARALVPLRERERAARIARADLVGLPGAPAPRRSRPA